MKQKHDRFRELTDRVRASIEYQAETLSQTFADQLWNAVSAQKIRQAEVARRAHVSRQFLTRVFKGDQNLTLKTIAKLANAADQRVYLHLAPADIECEWHRFYKADPRAALLRDNFTVDRACSHNTLSAVTPAEAHEEIRPAA
jgi:transcriptional regulator with XRE-family HTH domain